MVDGVDIVDLLRGWRMVLAIARNNQCNLAFTRYILADPPRWNSVDTRESNRPVSTRASPIAVYSSPCQQRNLRLFRQQATLQDMSCFAVQALSIQHLAFCPLGSLG